MMRICVKFKVKCDKNVLKSIKMQFRGCICKTFAKACWLSEYTIELFIFFNIYYD